MGRDRPAELGPSADMGEGALRGDARELVRAEVDQVTRLAARPSHPVHERPLYAR